MEIFKSYNILFPVYADVSLSRKASCYEAIAGETAWKFYFYLYHSLTDGLKNIFLFIPTEIKSGS